MKVINDCENYDITFPVFEIEYILKGYGNFFPLDNMENFILKTNSYKIFRRSQKMNI